MTNAGAERHLSIDAVRGMAGLGILLMNIVGMGLPSFAYINPTYAGGATGADFWTWAINWARWRTKNERRRSRSRVSRLALG